MSEDRTRWAKRNILLKRLWKQGNRNPPSSELDKAEALVSDEEAEAWLKEITFTEEDLDRLIGT